MKITQRRTHLSIKFKRRQMSNRRKKNARATHAHHPSKHHANRHRPMPQAQIRAGESGNMQLAGLLFDRPGQSVEHHKKLKMAVYQLY